ncbi:MAG: M15 family metallopeptidase [Actinomycetota bacterium]|nr:M15 family metallopeptidase [Actinomycetota bacterium]
MPIAALIVVLVGVLALALGRMGGAAAARADAQTAADAAALAGAADGREAAEALATANGARLVSFEQKDSDTRVVVELGPAQATGKARRQGGSGSGGSGEPGGSGSREGLAPAMKAALARAEQILGHQIPITSGYRSRQDQERLYANRANNPYPVAPPGSSMHEQGLAIDVPPEVVPDLVRVGTQAGLCHPFPEADPVHFEVCK